MQGNIDKTFLNRPDTKYLLSLLPHLKEKHMQKVTTIALSLVTFSFFAIFAIGPTVGTIADLRKQISDNQFVDAQLQQKIATLSSLEQSYTRLSPELPAVYNALPTTPQIAVFLGQLQTLSTLSNVTINTVQTLPVDFSPVDNPLKDTQFSFSVDVVGDKASTSLFLTNLVSLSRVVSIDAFTLSQNPKIASQYEMNIRGSLYYQAQ